MKLCPRCGEEKPLDDFPTRKDSRRKGDSVQAYCRSCYTVYWREYYHRDKLGHNRRAKRREDAIRAFVRAAKDKPCADCENRFPYYVMEFDHREGEEKCFNIADMNDRRGVSKMRLIAELAKCDVVCANCHRERTYQRKQRQTKQVGLPIPAE